MSLDHVQMPVPLRARGDTATAELVARSAALTSDAHLSIGNFTAWFAERAPTGRFRVDRIPLADLRGWSFEEETGNLRHETGRFFSVEGLRVALREDWYQPILNQPEVGILGLLAKKFDGELHFLMQAKMEPGNSNLVQLAPTVQATYSNYSRQHRGKSVRYLEYFVRPGRGRVLVDVLQSEPGWWFHRKSNRNMVVEVTDEVPHHEDFCWLTLGQIGELLRRDLVVGMDARSVLSCAPVRWDEPQALLSDTELQSWLTAKRSQRHLPAELVPLSRVPGWVRGGRSVYHEQDRYFRIVAVSVEAPSREVGQWTQPLLEPTGPGVIGFLTRRIGDVPHLLVQARAEPGLVHTYELGPTVQWRPGDQSHLTGSDRPPFLDAILSADPAQVRYEALLSEEGGRFRNADSRYLVVEAGDGAASLAPPPGYQWVTPGQLASLAEHGHYVNVEARTLLAGLKLRAVRI